MSSEEIFSRRPRGLRGVSHNPSKRYAIFESNIPEELAEVPMKPSRSSQVASTRMLSKTTNPNICQQQKQQQQQQQSKQKRQQQSLSGSFPEEEEQKCESGFTVEQVKQQTLPRQDKKNKNSQQERRTDEVIHFSPPQKSPSLESFLNEIPPMIGDNLKKGVSVNLPTLLLKEFSRPTIVGTRSPMNTLWPYPCEDEPFGEEVIYSSRKKLHEEKALFWGHCRNIWKNMNCVARALYDNVAESPDELAFCKGDLLTVLEQNTAGLEGWWLCSLRGRQGICPGNRLRIVPGCYDTGSGLTTLTGITSPTPGLQRGNSVPQQQRTPSKKVVTPKRVGDVYTYDTPRAHPQLTDYDVPPPRHKNDKITGSDSKLLRSSSLRYDSPRPVPRGSLEQYDTPRPLESQYDAPTSRPLYDSPKANPAQMLYDTPRPSEGSQGTRSLIKGIRGGQPSSSGGKASPIPSGLQQEYDVPRPAGAQTEGGDVPSGDRSSGVSLMSCDSTSSSASSLPASESLSLSSIGGSSNRSSLEAQDAYDVPPEPRRFVQKPRLPPREGLRDPGDGGVRPPKGGEAVYDVPPQVSRDTRSSDAVDSLLKRVSSGSDSSSGAEVDLGAFKELPLELDSARETLVKYEQEVLAAVEKVSALKAASRADKTEEARAGVLRLKEAVGRLLQFGRGAVGNAFRSGEHSLARRLSRLIDPIEAASVLTCDATTRVQNLPPGAPARAAALEQLCQVASIATSLGENARHLAGVIQSHAPLLFKRSPTIEHTLGRKLEDDEKTPVQERPLPDLPFQKKLGGDVSLEEGEAHTLLEDYDYVNLESKESVEREHREIMDALPPHMRKSYDDLVKQSLLTVDSDHKKALQQQRESNASSSPVTTPTNHLSSGSKNTTRIDANDRQVLSFYGAQARLHLQNLNSAIDAFLLTVENNQPPKVFIAHSKFVILSAHKLVYIGDTIHRNVMNAEIRTCVLNCTNALCDAMKNTVTAAKTAALQFPSVTAVQAMVDAFVTVSHLSNNLKKAICRD